MPGLICNIVVKADFGRSPGRSTLPVLTSSGQDWQLADQPADLPPNASWDIYYGIIWQPFWILQEKVGISFYF